MKRRIIAAITALLLAGVGAVVLLGYVGNADRRALAGMQTCGRARGDRTGAGGYDRRGAGQAGEYEDAAGQRRSPRARLSSLTAISGQVATTDLQPGEQVLASRFADPASLVDPDTVQIPAGLQQLSVSLDPQRVARWTPHRRGHGGRLPLRAQGWRGSRTDPPRAEQGPGHQGRWRQHHAGAGR